MMKIHDRLFTKLADLQPLKGSPRKSPGQKRDTGNDEVTSIELSRQGVLLQKAHEALRNESPDAMRSARLDKLKAAIENGTFEIDADAVSVKILRDALKDLID